MAAATHGQAVIPPDPTPIPEDPMPAGGCCGFSLLTGLSEQRALGWSRRKVCRCDQIAEAFTNLYGPRRDGKTRVWLTQVKAFGLQVGHGSSNVSRDPKGSRR